MNLEQKERDVIDIKLNGKVVSFGISSGDTLVLSDIETCFLYGREFVSGKIPKGATTNDWAEGNKGGIAVDAITDFMIFDSLDDYLAKIELSEV